MKRSPLLVALIAALACALPGLALPLMMDDWFHLSALSGWVGDGHPRLNTGGYFDGWVDPWGGPSCFLFFQGGEANLSQRAAGILPWWSGEDLRIAFLRPLSSLTHLLDYRLFGHGALGPNLHSLVWYLGLVAAVGVLYRRLLPPGLAALALLLYAVDDGHWFPVSWIANRNALVATLPAMLGLLAHLRWRREGWGPGLPLSVLGLGLGLAGGETALGVMGLVAGYQLFGEEGGWRARLTGLAPAVGLGLVWAGLYKGLGYGARGSGLYIDPSADPGAFLGAALVRAPVLLGGQVLGLPADAWFFAPFTKAILLVGGVVAVGVLIVALRWMWGAVAPETRAALGWLVPGSLLAMLPAVSTLPVNRMMLVPGMGLTVVMAAALELAWSRGRRWLAGAIALPHLALAPLTWWFLTGFSMGVNARYQALIQGDWLEEERPALVLNASDPGLAIYMQAERSWRAAPHPQPWRTLSMAPVDQRLTRLDEDSLRLELVEGEMGRTPFELLFRDFDGGPLEVGHRVEIPMAVVTVEAAEEGRPTAIRVDLEGAVEEHALLRWDGERFEVLSLAVGESVEVPHAPGPMGL